MAQNLKINILAKDKTKAALNGVRGRLAGLKNAVFSLKGAFVGLGAGLVIKSFVSTGRSIEDLQVRLKALFGSTQEGAKAFDVMAKFAARVPFSLEQIQAASGNLAIVAGDADRLSKILEITGNVAGATGLDFQQTAEQIQRSFAGGIAAADVFRERGVRQMLGFKAGATVTAEETVAAFEKVFGRGGKYGKVTEDLATTFTGTLSMLGDKLFNFKKNVADEQFFDELKKSFADLNKFIEDNSETFEMVAIAIGKTLTFAVKAFAAAVRTVAFAIRKVVQALEFLTGREFKRAIDNVPDAIGRGADIADKKLKPTLVETKTLLEEAQEQLKGISDKFKLSGLLVDTIKSGAASFSKSLAEAVVLGKNLNESFKQLAQQILINVIAKLIEQRLLLLANLALKKTEQILEDRKKRKIDQQNSSLKKQLSIQTAINALSGGFGGFFGGLFGKASGGAVSKGKPTIVGERGPELFVPNQTGQITQSARGVGGSPVNVNFTVNAIDTRGFQEALIQNRGTISNIINQAVNERGAKNLI